MNPQALAPPHLPGSYLVLELTNLCSLACVHCAVSEAAHPHHSQVGMMEPKVFESVVDDLVEVGARFDALILFWLGEPLLHPFFGRLRRHALRAAARHSTFGQIELHTNATHLDTQRVASLLNCSDVRQVIHFSIDASDRNTYRNIKGMDYFDRVQNNVIHFLSEKKRLGARWPRPVFQFIVGSNNVHQARAFRAFWEGQCHRLNLPVRAAAGQVPPGEDAVIFFRQLDCPTPQEQEQENALFRDEMAHQGLTLPIEAERGHTVRAENLSPCAGFWKSPVVGYRGDVTTCTLDSRFSNRLGSVRETRFSHLWWGRGMQQWREQVAAGDYSQRPLCQTCFIPQSINHSNLSDGDVQAQRRWAQGLA